MKICVCWFVADYVFYGFFFPPHTAPNIHYLPHSGRMTQPGHRFTHLDRIIICIWLHEWNILFTQKLCYSLDISFVNHHIKYPREITEPTSATVGHPQGHYEPLKHLHCQWGTKPLSSHQMSPYMTLCSFHTNCYAKATKVYPQCRKQSDDYIVALTFEAAPCQVSPKLIAHPVHYLP